MANAKKGLDVGLVFGAPPGKGGPGGGADDDHDEARDMLISALHDVGIKGDEASSLVDALHEYVESCVSKHDEAPEEESPEKGGEY